MTFWQDVLKASDIGPAFPWVILGFLLVAFLMAIYDPTARKRLRAAVVILVLAFIGTLLAGALLDYISEDTYFGYRCVRDLGVLLRTVAIVTLIGVIIFDVLLPAIRLQPPAILRDILLAVAYLLTAAISLMRLETGLTGVITTSAVATAVIGFALQSTFENVMGGMSLQMDRTINVGDWIKVEMFEGVVREIRWRQTSIETRDWNTVIIPNSVLMKSAVTVLGRMHGRPRQTRRWIYFQIDHGIPTDDVMTIVVSALRDEPIPGVAAEPEPNCILKDLRDAWQTFAVRYWLTDIAADDATDTVVRARVISALRRNNISFSFPTQSLMLHSMDADYTRREEEKGTAQRLAAVARVSIFDTLTENERNELANRLVVTPFTRGEVITRQGSQADCLFIITKGDAEVRVSSDTGDISNGHSHPHSPSKTVATLRTGDFFGEMALLTGATRTATVVATTDTTCYRLDKESFIDILRRRPAIAEGISHILARRRVELDAAKDHLDAESQRQRLQSTEGDLLAKIRRFFTLDSSH
jgi:small-conductance mechanosensitive channel/CRP-like cAMP-binding protein